MTQKLIDSRSVNETGNIQLIKTGHEDYEIRCSDQGRPLYVENTDDALSLISAVAEFAEEVEKL
ncbi:hypothetical protein HISP_14411 [Haloarcula hispanica N601]|uniref:Uncharacterized protein n=3 Tax=root TaxID=1 RepID=W0GDK7_HALHI|nr:hypothetical protein [Haloarcula hispanica]YP_009798572.1 putative protein 9 [Haloarcula hispanica pleomorphic virus 3]QRG24206.1 hypothetical protein HarHp1_045 [Haloarcula virus Harhisp1]AEM58414.1 hypothetical protein HAH_2834 [Haloarcula hispanica ATCC 33960]AHF55870.1 hypothetical protein HISP_14411 [Haloarcula hispanica N601]ANW09670.1 putative protein 9 [Haloarcula hispanica pleomorphic virus 3]